MPPLCPAVEGPVLGRRLSDDSFRGFRLRFGGEGLGVAQVNYHLDPFDDPLGPAMSVTIDRAMTVLRAVRWKRIRISFR